MHNHKGSIINDIVILKRRKSYDKITIIRKRGRLQNKQIANKM